MIHANLLERLLAALLIGMVPQSMVPFAAATTKQTECLVAEAAVAAKEAAATRPEATGKQTVVLPLQTSRWPPHPLPFP